MPTHAHGSFWPTPQQETLLVAALAEPDAAAAAWESRGPAFDFERLEPGSFELLPLIYRKLVDAGSDDPLLQRLKGIYRKAFVTNTLLLKRTAETFSALVDADVATLLVDGSVVAARFYPELGLRPSANVEVLIDAPSAAGAAPALAVAGWQPREDLNDRRTDRAFFGDSDGTLCVVRSSLAVDFSGGSGRRAAHRPLWDAAEPFVLGETTVLVPSRTDSFVALAVLHARAEGARTTQWIADAKMVLAAGELDWPRVAGLASSAGQTVRMRAVLDYLSKAPGPRPPREAGERLAGRAALRERVGYVCTSGSIRGAGAFPWLVAEHLADTRDSSLARAVVSFPAHLQRRWGLMHLRQVPAAAIRRLIGVTGKRRREAMRQ